MAVNVRGPFRYAQAAMPHLQQRKGCMIHMGSDAGVIGEVEIGVYSVSKAAVHMLSNMLAIEAGRLGVRSNAIAPGDTEPGMRHMGPPGEPDRPEDDPATWPVPPVGRIGRASDVAEAAVYLASDRAVVRQRRGAPAGRRHAGRLQHRRPRAEEPRMNRFVPTPTVSTRN